MCHHDRVSTLASIFRIFLFFLVISVARAEEPEPARRVIGGDILHTAQGLGSTPEEALFKAQTEAVKSLSVECGIPHIATVVYKKEVFRQASSFVAEVQVGLPFDDCEAGKRGSPQARKRLSHPMLEKDLEAYNRSLRGEPKREEEEEIKSLLHSQFGRVHERFDQVDERLDRLEEASPKTTMASALPRAPAAHSNSAHSACRGQYKALMGQANTAAMTNNPPGNLAEGQALMFYNQAQAVLAHCN
jgi:hypothetical protein